MRKHAPFESNYLDKFEVVEQVKGSTRLYPHTEQLPQLSRSINREFESGLTTRLATTDGRADPARKFQLSEAALAFCAFLNSQRPDHLHIQPYFTSELVAQIAVVQQITQVESLGNRHWFRFFRSEAFLPDIYLSGKRLVFASHVIDRYRERTLGLHAHPTVNLLTELFQTPVVLLCLNGHEPVLVFQTSGGVAVMPFKESADEFFLLSTLTPGERGTLTPLSPPRPAYLHYGPACPVPRDGNFDMAEHIASLIHNWHNPKPRADDISALEAKLRRVGWTRVVQATQRKARHAPPVQLRFHDGIYGPTLVTRPVPPGTG